MNILPLCQLCGNPFTSRRSLQQRCPSCVLKSKSCEVCAAKKRSHGPLCQKCEHAARIGKPNLKNRREEMPIEQVISEAEAIGLLLEKQYAFGYVIGVVFGDGCITKETNTIPHTYSDGTVGFHDSTIRRVRLSVTSQAFAERFAKQWEILTGKPAKVYPSTRTNFDKSTLKGRREGYCVQLFNVRQCHALFTRYLSHLKHDSELYDLLHFPSEVMLGIIHGMIDSEGYVSPEYIDISNKRATLLDVLTLMLELLGYKATVYTSPSQTISHLRTDIPYTKYGL